MINFLIAFFNHLKTKLIVYFKSLNCASLKQFSGSTLKMSDITFYSAVKPFLVMNKIVGLVPFSFSESGYKLSNLNTGINVVISIVYGLLSVHAIYLHLIDYEGTTLVVTSDNIQVCSASIFIVVTWVYIAICQKKHMTLLLRFVSIDRQLKKIGEAFAYKKLRNNIYYFTLVSISIVLLNIAFQLYVYDNLYDLKHITFNITYNFPTLLNAAVCLHVSFFVLLTKQRFKLLNVHLKELRKINTITIIGVSDNGKSNTTKTVLNSLRNLCYLHHQLTKMIKLTNVIFGPILLFSFITSFVAIVVGLYFCSRAFQTMQKDWADYVVPVISCSTNIVTTIFVCTICQSTIDEVNKAGILIHKIDTEDYDTKDQIEMFSLQIATEQAEYNAAGFFSIDYTLLFSIIAGVTTYLIILIQLSS